MERDLPRSQIETSFISYGFVFLLFFSSSVLTAEEIGQVETPSEVKGPLQVIVMGVKGEELDPG